MTSTAVFVSLNPAIGTLLCFRSLQLSATNRCLSEPIDWADGKAVNAARAFKRLGGAPLVLAVRAGNRGAAFAKLLQTESLSAELVEVPGECRRAYALLSFDSTEPTDTRLLEPGPVLRKPQLDKVARVLKRVCRTTKVCSLAGSLSPGTSPDSYARLIREMRSVSDCRILLDTSGDALRASLVASPDIVKINLEEFTGLAMLGSAPSDADIVDQMRAMSEAYCINTVILTRGPHSVLAYSGSQGAFAATPPKVEIKNPVGAGDSFSAGFLRYSDKPFRIALRMAVATGSASTTGIVPGRVRAGVVSGISRRVHVARATWFAPQDRRLSVALKAPDSK